MKPIPFPVLFGLFAGAVLGGLVLTGVLNAVDGAKPQAVTALSANLVQTPENQPWPAAPVIPMDSAAKPEFVNYLSFKNWLQTPKTGPFTLTSHRDATGALVWEYVLHYGDRKEPWRTITLPDSQVPFKANWAPKNGWFEVTYLDRKDILPTRITFHGANDTVFHSVEVDGLDHVQESGLNRNAELSDEEIERQIARA